MIDFSMILAKNNRSKAYIQNLIKHNIFPKKVIILKNDDFLSEHTIYDKFMFKNQKFIKKINDIGEFDEKEDIEVTLKKYNINYFFTNKDINSEIAINDIKSLPTKYIIYSGFGGVILKQALDIDKKFIHVHPGILPKYKGSTTIYYSYLNEKKFGASVIIFNKDIDSGEILYQKEFIIKEKNIDFDYILDPLIRANTLVEFLKKDLYKKVQEQEGNTFYITHPILKHLAILRYYYDKS